MLGGGCKDMDISIHTSAREVTDLFTSSSQTMWFQSTLPQGKWQRLYLTSPTCINFNPHFRKGSDRQPPSASSPDLAISIHTSAREVTMVNHVLYFIISYFNPHFRKGSDSSPADIVYHNLGFQSTLPQGKWRIIAFFKTKVESISIHTSAREVTAIFHKNICLFLWNIYKYIWIYFRILLKYSVYTKSTFKFVYFYRCESPGNFMYARHSHLQIIRIKADRLQFLVLHLYALSWSYNYFQDSRIASYLLYHQ